MMRLIARSLKIRLESVIENIKTEKDIFKEIQKVFKKYKLQTKMSYGDNYDFR